ncbi:MAG: hypothetical protein ACJ8AT_15485 [Hyalangium sp.]|uniref:hypothetical protein n=1 Tax=Hyalangium sp. TaxID=2028555 RepID=UPI00389982BF
MFSLLKFKEDTTTQPNTTGIEGMTLDQVRVELLGLMAQESTQHHRMGLLYNYVVQKRLAEKAGFKDARDYLSQHLADLSQSALSMYGAVADAFSEPVTRRFGVTCLYLLLIYQEAAAVELNHAEPGDTLIDVPQADGQVAAQPFKTCSVEQMRKALQLKRKPSSSKPLPPEAVARAEQLQEAVAGLFPKGVSVKVTVRNLKGKAVLDFKGIPWEQVDQLIQALAGGQPSVSAERS